MPTVSVIIPTHNRAEAVFNAIMSVIKQTFQDLEIIVVDDASNDNTAEVLARFSDKRLRLIRHEIKKGGAAARNTGILNSNSNYIAFLDDDDEWLPDKLAKQMAALLASPSEVGCVYTGYFDVEKSTKRVVGKQIHTKRGNLSRELTLENCVGSTSSVLLKKECLTKVGLFDETLPCCQDFDLWIRIAKEFLFECVQEPLFMYYVHSDKISANPEARSRGLEIMQGKHINPPISNRYYSKAYVDLGILQCLAGHIGRGRQSFLRAVQFRPLQIRGYLNLGLTLLGASRFRKVKQAKWRIFRSPQESGVAAT